MILILPQRLLLIVLLCSPPLQPQHSLSSTQRLLSARSHTTGLLYEQSHRPAPNLHEAAFTTALLPRTRGGLECMCQPRRQAGRQRPPWGQFSRCAAVAWRHVEGFRSTWSKLKRLGRGGTRKTVTETDISGNAVGLEREASTGRFSRTATITGSFVALPRCCDKGGEDCRGGTDHQKWGRDDVPREEIMWSAFERGRTLATGGGMAGWFVSLRASDHRTLGARSQLLRPTGRGRRIGGGGDVIQGAQSA